VADANATLKEILSARRVQLADRWRRGIAGTGYVPLGASELSEVFLALADDTIGVLIDQAADARAARRIGAELVSIGYTAPEVLGTTLELLGEQLIAGLSPVDLQRVQPRLAVVQGGIAAGFASAARERLLVEQEATRTAVHVENRRAGEAIRRQAALLDLAPDAILVRAMDGTILFWNRGAEILYGWSRAEANGRIVHDLLETRFPRPRREVEAAVLTNGRWDGELIHTSRAGKTMTVSSRWALQPAGDGHEQSFLEINTDISVRKAMEATLREREASLENAQSLAHLGSWESHVLTNETFWSHEARRLLGYADTEVQPSREALLAAVHPQDLPLVKRAVEDAYTGKSYVFEFRALGADGVERVLQSQSDFVPDASGLPVRLFGTLLDVTERKRAEAERLQLLSEQSARAEAEEAQSRFAFLAEASTRLASSLDYELTLRNVAELLVPTLADACTVDILLENGDLRRVAATHLAEGALEGHVLVRVPLVARGRVLGAITCFGFDTRATYTPIEQALAEELGRRGGLAIDNARLHAEAQRATHLRDEFLSVAAHELKTPMTTLRGYAQLLGRSLGEGQMPPLGLLQRGVEAIDWQSEKLVRLTEQLLDVSRIEAGKLQLSERPADLVELVRDIVQSIQESTQRHTLTLLAPETCFATVDPMRLEQVVANLVGNAVKYSPTGGAIEVTLSKPDPTRIEMIVRDWGLGIPPDRRGNLFDRFYQAHGEGNFGGLGLGLYVSRQIVELHGGTIEADFPSDGGSRFIVSLPAS
jgi:PAS domain S-box-containing protein